MVFILSRNISVYVISALCGNWWIESGINSGIYESLVVTPPDFIYHNNQGGFGLGQWTNWQNPNTGAVSWRRRNLHDWLIANNYTDDSFSGQIEYLFVEAHWVQRSEYPEFTSLDDFLNSSSMDIARLTHAFNLCWEGIHDSSWDTRVDRANQVYQYILEHSSDPAVTPIIGNRYLSESERLNNALAVYQYLGGVVPPPHPPQPIVLIDILPAIISSKRRRKELV